MKKSVSVIRQAYDNASIPTRKTFLKVLVCNTGFYHSFFNRFSYDVDDLCQIQAGLAKACIDILKVEPLYFHQYKKPESMMLHKTKNVKQVDLIELV